MGREHGIVWECSLSCLCCLGWPGLGWDGLVASSGERLARCWTWCAAIILPSYMLGGERYNLVVFYSLWYSLTQCTGGTVWHTLVVQFGEMVARGWLGANQD